MTEQGNLFDRGGRRRLKKSAGDRYLVKLTAEEMAWAEHLAKLQESDWNGRFSMDTPAIVRHWAHVIGARGEIATAKHYDLLLTDFLGRWAPAPDFGPREGPGLCVRTTAKKFYPGIPVHVQDGDGCVVLRVCEFEPGTYRLHAWCSVRDAKAHTPLTNPKPFGEVESQPVHIVPLTIENDPNPIVHILGTYPYPGREIPQQILKLCPRGYRPWSVR